MSKNGKAFVLPIKRGVLRLWLGRLFYTYKRYLRWVFGGICFAKRNPTQNHETNAFPFTYASHSTPLLRSLKNVDMYLQYNKITNLNIAAARLNGVVLHPGETFSYWKLIGKPTRRKGYLKGMILQNGKYTAGTGGGLCQLSNLLYWMTLHTPLTVTERHRHGYDVFPDSDRTQPFGSGATCFYNYVDLMIQNHTDKPFRLSVKVTEKDLEGAWLSAAPQDTRYEVYEKDHTIRSHYGQYTRHNVIFRKAYDMNGVIIYDEYITENHAVMMYAPLLPDNTRMEANRWKA